MQGSQERDDDVNENWFWSFRMHGLMLVAKMVIWSSKREHHWTSGEYVASCDAMSTLQGCSMHAGKEHGLTKKANHFFMHGVFSAPFRQIQLLWSL